MSENEQSQEKYLGELLEIGSGVAGSIAGTAIGLAVAGPPGAYAGAVGGPLVERTTLYLAGEFRHRFLGKREEERIGGTMAFTIRKIQENVNKGEQVRQDGFFEDQASERAAAKEVGEAVLLAASREHQEKKLPFYGNLLANIAFDPTISREQANLLVQEGQRLSYRQLCVLAFLAAKQLYEGESRIVELRPIIGLEAEAFLLRQQNYEDSGGVPDMECGSLLHEIFDLHLRNLVSTGVDLPGSTYIEPAKLRIVLLAYNLYRLMELWNIDKSDTKRVALLLH